MVNEAKRAAVSPANSHSPPAWALDLKEDIKLHTTNELAKIRDDIREIEKTVQKNSDAIQRHENVLLPIQQTHEQILLNNEEFRQSALQNNMLISNVPIVQNESPEILRSLLETICNIMNIRLNFEDDVLEIVRLSTKDKNTAGPILVKFYNLRIKRKIMSLKAESSLRLGQLFHNESIEKVYLNHQLTKYYQNLLKSVRDINKKVIKANFVWFAWRQNCIFMKKDEKSTPIKISTPQDLALAEAKLNNRK
jgi:hypothetical protein